MTRVYTDKALENSETRSDFTIDPLELFEMLRNNEDINVIDVREPFDFAIGHIPGALNLPKRVWSSNFGPAEDKFNIIYSYSTNYHLAADASKYFAECGFNVVILDGGFKQWQQHNLPVVQ